MYLMVPTFKNICKEWYFSAKKIDESVKTNFLEELFKL